MTNVSRHVRYLYTTKDQSIYTNSNTKDRPPHSLPILRLFQPQFGRPQNPQKPQCLDVDLPFDPVLPTPRWSLARTQLRYSERSRLECRAGAPRLVTRE